jgi:hypothetical protein
MSTHPHVPRTEAPRPKAVLPCLVHGCEKDAFCRGWCQAHYRRWYRYGDPEASKPREHRERPTWQDRWNAKVQVRRTGCHEWHGQYVKGLPMFQAPTDPEDDRSPKVRVIAYRWAWQQRNPRARLKNAERLLRDCGNGRCVNPEHVRRVMHRDVEEAKQQALAKRRKTDKAYRDRLKATVSEDEALPL